MKRIKLLDCTLRDGGWINDFCFGKELMNRLEFSLEDSGIEYVELGYLDENKGTWINRSMYKDYSALGYNFSYGMNSDVVRVVMIDYGKFDIEKLPILSSDNQNMLDGIRLCFHKKDAKYAVLQGKKIIDKGYKLFLQPMVTTRYSNAEFVDLIEYAQEELEKLFAFYVVDSFGAMHEKEICDRIILADSVLNPEIVLGIHTHDNLNKSFSNAQAICFKVFETDALRKEREFILDSSLCGMGKGAGNLYTEKIAKYLNEKYSYDYDEECLYSMAECLIEPIRSNLAWGTTPEYELAAKYRVTPTYARIFGQKNISLQEIESLLSGIPEEKKDSFDKTFAEEYMMKSESLLKMQ